MKTLNFAQLIIPKDLIGRYEINRVSTNQITLFRKIATLYLYFPGFIDLFRSLRKQLQSGFENQFTINYQPV